MGKPEGKRPFERPRHRWEDNVKMDLREVGGGCEDWMELAQDRDRWRALVSTVMNLQGSKNAGNFLTSFKSGHGPHLFRIVICVVLVIVLCYCLYAVLLLLCCTVIVLLGYYLCCPMY